MERELNQKLIEKLRNKEIWLHYGDLRAEGDLEGLRLVIKTAFPKDKSIVHGSADYYISMGNDWDGKGPELPDGVTAHELEDFFIVDTVVHNYEIY